MSPGFMPKRVVSVPRLIGQLLRDPGEPSGLLWAFLANEVAASFLVPARVRTVMYKVLGIRVSSSALIRPGVIIRARQLVVGARSTVNYSCIFDNRAGVFIGSQVGIGIGVKFLNTDHDTADPKRRAGIGISKRIVVEDGAYIGSGAVVLSGVRVRSGAVVAAGAVVTSDCEADGVYAGIPARRIKDLPVTDDH